MRQVESGPSLATDLDVKLLCAAHHEAGHIVVAAAQGLRLRPQGLSIDPSGEGLACYFKQPDGSDTSRERVIVAMFAGFMAQKRFCEQRSCPVPYPMGVVLSPDWQEARQIISMLSAEYSSDDRTTIQRRLENRSDQFVERHWIAIEALAAALLAKSPEPLKPLKSGGAWSREGTAKYVPGEEVVSILGRYGIIAVCESDC